ncbi:MAG: KH domain-containing protein [Desulfurococcales archaeon]|nr:KH domain-containing protein [Desulfurococcales archaeon]MCE4622733.1 KH domain-containing protein [Desulfurococcales archaeon]MCE4626210.1 KH domain-containing protein [Desulfurococcales archaeon]MCE4629466.1 KH domain-containing protein [Desulfurococcales archaeon]NOZ31161.1 RNA-processing protein [Thermoproteota archaeon]
MAVGEGRPRIYVKVPIDRLGAVIGKKGEVKLKLIEKLGVRLTIDSENSMVIVEPEAPNIPPINMMKAAEIIKAIAYGFPPEKAFRLLDDEQILVIVDLKQIVGDSPNHLKRVKGRIIGEGGRARKTIEEMTGTDIFVGDHYVAIIGDYERAMAAKKAVEMLAEGRMHSTVYRYLDRVLREIKRREALRMWAKDEFNEF